MEIRYVIAKELDDVINSDYRYRYYEILATAKKEIDERVARGIVNYKLYRVTIEEMTWLDK